MRDLEKRGERTKKLKKGVVRAIPVWLMVMIFSLTVLAASITLNGGDATWSGGKNADVIKQPVIHWSIEK